MTAQVDNPTAEQNFRLVAILEDGTPDDPRPVLDPEHRQACEAMSGLYQQLGFQPPWTGYVAVRAGHAVGGGAFVGPPVDGRVEIAYYTSASEQGKGYAGLTAQHLVSIAREAAPDVQVSAKTEPRLNASTRILTRLGFEHVGSTEDHEIGEAWLWLLDRSR